MSLPPAPPSSGQPSGALAQSSPKTEFSPATASKSEGGWISSVSATPMGATQQFYSFATVAKKFSEGGVKALTPNEFATLTTFTEKATKEPKSFLARAQEGKADQLSNLAFAVATELKAADSRGEVSQYLQVHKLTAETSAQDWQKAIQNLPIQSPVIETNLGRQLNENAGTFDSVMMPFATASKPILMTEFINGPWAQTINQNSSFLGQALPNQTPAIPPAQPAVNPGHTPHVGGTDRYHPIHLSPSEAVHAITVDDFIDVIGADALVLAAKGKIGVQSIPGFDKIPFLRKLGANATVNYLAATLTPMDVWKDGKLDITMHPLKTTLFLSLSVPKINPRPDVKKTHDFVVTVQLSEMNAEIGMPIKNKLVADGKIILFSNWRGHITAIAEDPTHMSVNGGVLMRVNGVKKVIKQVKTAVTTMTRGVQAVQATSAAATAPATGGGSLVAGAGAVAATEAARYTLFKSLTDADYYVGFAWRLSDSLQVIDGEAKNVLQKGNSLMDASGNVTLEAKAGEHKGKWVRFNIADLPGGFFENRIPDLDASNQPVDEDPIIYGP